MARDGGTAGTWSPPRARLPRHLSATGRSCRRCTPGRHGQQRARPWQPVRGGGGRSGGAAGRHGPRAAAEGPCQVSLASRSRGSCAAAAARCRACRRRAWDPAERRQLLRDRARVVGARRQVSRRGFVGAALRARARPLPAARLQEARLLRPRHAGAAGSAACQLRPAAAGGSGGARPAAAGAAAAAVRPALPRPAHLCRAACCVPAPHDVGPGHRDAWAAPHARSHPRPASHHGCCLALTPPQVASAAGAEVQLWKSCCYQAIEEFRSRIRQAEKVWGRSTPTPHEPLHCMAGVRARLGLITSCILDGEPAGRCCSRLGLPSRAGAWVWCAPLALACSCAAGTPPARAGWCGGRGAAAQGGCRIRQVHR